MPAGPLIRIYCGVARYLANSASHAAWVRGRAPLTGFHSVIDTPDSVRRVMPPTTTMPTTMAATTHNQRAICNGRALEEKPIFMSCVLAPAS
jgi:hypothetical protein